MAIRKLVSSEVLHECYDVEDDGVENILVCYGVFYQFTKEELAILKEYLLEMAAREEIREAVRWAGQEHDLIILSVPDRRAPGLKTLELQHKAWKAEMAAKQQVASDEVEPDPIIEILQKIQRSEVL